jgi:membrane-bound lytic murein transglycosylase A
MFRPSAASVGATFGVGGLRPYIWLRQKRREMALLGLAFAGLLAIDGCATNPQSPMSESPPPAAYGPQVRTPPLRPSTPPLAFASFVPLTELRDWRDDDHVQALAAYRLGCGVSRDPTAELVCARARALGSVDELAARRFFEANFRAQIFLNSGLLTAYFAPEYPARRTQDAEFSAALRPMPPDLVLQDPTSRDPIVRKTPRLLLDGSLLPYPNRTDIELLPPVEPLAWMRPEDLFFLQIQGSGGIDFPDGTRMKALYAADNGQPFIPIAPEMVRRGLLAPNHASGEAIRRWLADHRGPQAQTIMDLDPRYLFFKLAPDDGGEPVGGAGLPLPPGRSIAVDTTWRAYGDLYWIEATSPVLAGAMKTYRRLVVALDTGSAIKGSVRADLYLGRGAAAGLEAGRVRHTLTMVRLVPLAQPDPPSISARNVQDESGGGSHHETPPSPGGD